MSGNYKSEGIILLRRNISEADRILVVYSKYFGKITTIAKGVRRPISRKRGSLEVFSQIRFSAVKGKNMDIMTEVESVNNFDGIRNNLTRISVAYFFIETINKSTADSEENLGLYDLLLDYLEKLQFRKDLKDLRSEFILELLIELGFWPKDKVLKNHDNVLESVLEKQVFSSRIGRAMLT